MPIKKSEFKVAKTSCKQCLFSKNKIVSDDRKQEVLDSIDDGSHFTCHLASRCGQDVCCRGFYDRNLNLKVRLAKLLEYSNPGFVEFVNLNKDGKNENV